MPPAEAEQGTLVRLQRVLVPIPWIVIAVGLVVNQLVASGSALQTIALLIVLAIFFVSVLGRLVCVAIASPARRVPLLVLLFAVVTWAMGSLSVNSSGGIGGPDEFPASGGIHFTAWAEVAHAELPGGRNKPDIDMVAARFRQWAAEKGIPLKGPQILPAFEGFCRKWKIRD